MLKQYCTGKYHSVLGAQQQQVMVFRTIVMNASLMRLYLGLQCGVYQQRMHTRLPNINYPQAICLATMPAAEDNIANVHLLAFRIEQKIENALTHIF